MKNKDTQLLEEAYQSIYEAGMLSNMIDKGKAMIGMGPGKPITFEQASEQFTKALTSMGYSVFTNSREDPVAFYESGGGGRGYFLWLVTPQGFHLNNTPKDKFVAIYSKLPDSSNGEQLYQGHTDPLTDKNLNAVIKQAKPVLALIKQQIAQEEKDAPEREKQRQSQDAKDKQKKSDEFWDRRLRSYLDTKSPEEAYRLIDKQRAESDAARNAS